MSQEVATLRDAAVSNGILSKLPDVALICEKLEAALSKEGIQVGNYSEALLHIFQKAWALAQLSQNTQVTVHHLAYALVLENGPEGRTLADHLETDPLALCIGCLSQFIGLGLPVRQGELPGAAVGTARWIVAAVEMAQEDGLDDTGPLQLVSAVMEDRPDSVLALLRRAARAGKSRQDQLIGPRPAAASEPPPALGLEDARHMAAIDGPVVITETTELAALIETLNHHKQALLRSDGQMVPMGSGADGAVTNQLQTIEKRIGNIEGYLESSLSAVDKSVGRLDAIDQQVAGLARRVEPVGELPAMLDKIERRVTAIEQGLPRPPSGLRLAAAIAVVVAIGAAVGLLLTQWQTTSRAADARTVNIEQSR